MRDRLRETWIDRAGRIAGTAVCAVFVGAVAGSAARLIATVC